MRIEAYCETCRHRHPIETDPARPDNQLNDWYTKHAGHFGVGFCWPERTQKPSWVDRLKRFWSFARRSPRPGFEPGHVSATPREIHGHLVGERPSAILSFLPNATVKTTYAASAAPTLTLASLAASSTWLAGRESSTVDNTSNLYLDYLVGGFFKQAATNTQAGLIKVGVVGVLNDSPTYPDVFDGTDSTETVTTQAIYDACVRVLVGIVTAATASAVNPFAPTSIAQFFGYQMPLKWVYFISHNAQTTTNAWDATEGSHSVKHTGTYLTVA